MNKNLLLTSLLFISLLGFPANGMEKRVATNDHWAGPRMAHARRKVDPSERRNLGTLSILPNDPLNSIIDHVLPTQINSMQDLQQAWKFISCFAQLNNHCAEMVRSDFISHILASKIGHQTANTCWGTAFKHVSDIKNNNKWFQILAALLKAGAEESAEHRVRVFRHALDNGYLDAVRLLLQQNITYEQDKNGNTVLMEAAFWGCKDIVLLLLLEQAPVNLQNNNGRTALMAAAQNGNQDVVGKLLQCGANVHLTNNCGKTALMLAVESGDLLRKYKNTSELLLLYGAHVNLQDNEGKTPLMAAAQNNRTDIVTLLDEHGATLDFQNSNGRTALMVATQHGHTKIVELLLRMGVNVNLQLNDGRTAIDLVTKQEIEDLLVAQKRQA